MSTPTTPAEDQDTPEGRPDVAPEPDAAAGDDRSTEALEDAGVLTPDERQDMSTEESANPSDA